MLRWLWVSAVVMVLDQATKLWAAEALRPYEVRPVVDGLFNLTLAFNEGAAFSFLADAGGWQRWFFAVLAVIVATVFAVWLARLDRAERMTAAALAFLIGGAAGNLVDRVRVGYVIDFIDFYHESLAGWPGFSTEGHWPVFNIADTAITIGVVLMLLASLRRTDQRARPPGPAPDARQ
jgi:signal peptidase II